MEVRKEKLATFFKGKGFYTALAVGAAAIFAVGMISTNMISNDSEELAENPSSQVAENARQGEDNTNITENGNAGNSNQNETTGTTSKENNGAAATEKEPANISEQTEALQEEEMSDLVEPSPDEKKAMEEAMSQNQTEEPVVAEVLSQESQINNLVFNEEDGLVWPVQGEILLEYSMDKPIYFKTLAQYKCNSAIVIEAKEKTEVYSAAKAVITDISTTDETGTTITASIGNDYQLIYGQLSDVQVKVGDIVEKGALLGTVAAPTRYYVEEGSNLYFKVMHGEESVNPLLLLD